MNVGLHLMERWFHTTIASLQAYDSGTVNLDGLLGMMKAQLAAIPPEADLSDGLCPFPLLAARSIVLKAIGRLTGDGSSQEELDWSLRSTARHLTASFLNGTQVYWIDTHLTRFGGDYDPVFAPVRQIPEALTRFQDWIKRVLDRDGNIGPDLWADLDMEMLCLHPDCYVGVVGEQLARCVLGDDTDVLFSPDWRQALMLHGLVLDEIRTLQARTWWSRLTGAEAYELRVGFSRLYQIIQMPSCVGLEGM